MTTALSFEQKKHLFNRRQFLAELTTSPDLSLVCRTWLERTSTIMDRWFSEGEQIQKLVSGRAWLIDQIVIIAWEHLVVRNADDIALTAVGGYGRGELHPHSDIDLLILLKDEDTSRYRGAIAQFLTLLWDSQLKVGSSVRSVQECSKLGRQDLTIITTMIESRLLSGNAALFNAMQSEIAPAKMWSSHDYLQAKYNEQRARHRKFNQTEYNLEPNLKSSPGGLRDLHMIGWVARRHFGTDTPRKLVNIGFLLEREYRTLVRARDFLWKVRWALHRLAGRREDRLLFDYQRTLASEFGANEFNYQDRNNGTLAVEQFMRDYFRAVMRLGVLNDLLLQHFDVTILNKGGQHAPTRLNKRFQIANHYLDATDRKIFFTYPPAIMEAFVLMSSNPSIEGMTAETIRALRDARHLIDDNFRADPEIQKLFLSLMTAPYALTASLRRMVRYGILGRYLPEFGKIIGQMQYDLFHNYTVDAHTLLLIKYLRRFNYQESQEQFPLAYSVKKRLAKPELLYIAGLYHDIGKGQGGNHSIIGAEQVTQFAHRHGLSTTDRSLVEWLVRNHLVMSMTAQKQDLSDPQTIHNFACLVGDFQRLDYLYCLTVADINATNPNLWNSWRATLLRKLFSETQGALHRGLENPIDKQERIDDTRNQARIVLAQQQAEIKDVESFWNGLGDNYFLRHSVEEVVWQTQAILACRGQPPLVLVRESTERRYEGGTVVFVNTPDVPNLFAICAIALNQLNLTIHDAHIITSASGFALDTFVVLDALTGKPLGDDHQRIAGIRAHICCQLTSDQPPQPDRTSYYTPRQLKHFTRPPTIIISDDPINHRTVVEIKATDRPGLLASLGKVFMEQKIIIQSAKIATLGEKVEDVFFITDQDHNPIGDSAQSQQLQTALSQTLQALISN